LTEEGYALVETAQRLCVVMDLAHAERKTALDALEAARRPVVISHANVNDVYRHPRNVDSEVIKRLVDNGGVLGLIFIPRTISDSPTLSALVKHAKYVKERYGVEVLAVGDRLPRHLYDAARPRVCGQDRDVLQGVERDGLQRRGGGGRGVAQRLQSPKRGLGLIRRVPSAEPAPPPPAGP
jgi:hypothetical protein